MAIKNSLTNKNEANYYGIDFKQAYFKIEDVQTNFEKNEVVVYLRAYASEAARKKEKEYKTLKEKWSKICMGGEEFDKAFKESDYEDEEKFKEYAREMNDQPLKHVIGIYKEKFEIKLEDLKVKTFTKDGIITACYEYLKKLDMFKKGENC